MGFPGPLQAPQVLSESARWLALAKPAGWWTIPGRSAPGQSAPPVLSEWAREHCGPVWVVHRLDRETSGVLLLARSAEAHREANAWFASHQVRKRYLFLAEGEPAQPLMRVREPIAGASATTQLEVLERYAGAFFGAAVPLTGRRHQIRLHLAHLRHPILGDVEYGGPRERRVGEASLMIERVALHAARLELPDGSVFEAALPEDFERWKQALQAARGTS